jgi:prepilin-type N-terminal cleavage/methylation domain-containing protein
MMARKGFTLVELLVVISIIALLASFLLPGLSRAREYAYLTTCKNNLRQTAIGFLIYAADNNGELPGDGNRCTGSSYSVYRRIGTSSMWGFSGGGTFVKQVYGDLYPGEHWNGTVAKSYGRWLYGRPRQPGRYVKVGVLWDPIVKKRDWLYCAWLWSGSSYRWYMGEERARDRMFRGKGTMGYSVFLTSVGCWKYKTEGWTDHATGNWLRNEEHMRWNTNHQHVRTSHKPSVWLAACKEPALEQPFKSNYYTYVSHFGAVQAAAQAFRFNVVHLDGHVHDATWKAPQIGSSNWADFLRDWLYPGEHGHPYGWVPEGYNFSSGKIGSVARTPWMTRGAFDENK